MHPILEKFEWFKGVVPARFYITEIGAKTRCEFNIGAPNENDQ